MRPLPRGSEALAITGLTADSRQVKPGFLFAALPGTKADGAQFIPQAVDGGRRGGLASDSRAAVPTACRG